jgi:PAS domain S-box-containing protein
MNHEAGSDGGSLPGGDVAAARRCRSLVSAVEGAVFDVEADGTLDAVGADLLSLTGHERSALEGAHATRILDEDAVAALERAVESREVGETTAVEATVTTTDGERVPGDLRFSPVGGESGPGGVAIFRADAGNARTTDGQSEADLTADTRADDAQPTAASRGHAQGAGSGGGAADVENHYGALAEQFPNGVLTVYDQDLRYTLAAGQGFENLSVDTEGVEGHTVREVWGEDAAETLEPTLRAALEGEEGSVELTFEDRDWLLRAVPITDEAGEVTAGGTVTIDITERRQAERELQRREEQLSRLMRNVPGMVYRCENARGWPMDFVSHGCRDLTGYDPEELVSGDVSFGNDVVHDDDSEELWTEVQDVVTDREPFSVTYRIETPDGERRWVADHGRGIFDDGDLVGIEGVIIDVTERKLTEAELEENARRYRTLVDNFPNGGVALFDEDLRYIAAGGTVFDDIEDSETEVVGQTVRERYPDAIADELEPRFRAALDGEATTASFALHGREWEANVHPIEEDDDGEISAGVIMVQDVTQRGERERELRRSERRYRTLVDNFPNGAVALVDEDLRYQTIGGTPPGEIDSTGDELIGEPVREALPEFLGERLTAAYETAFDGETDSFEWESADRVYRFYTVPVRADDGEVFAAMGMSQDITEQKRQERRFREAKAQLEAATEAAAIGTWEWDVQDDVFVAGASLAKIFGVDPEAARDGVPLETFITSIHEPDRDRVLERIESTLESCGEYEAEYRVRDADGDLRWVFARGRVECDGDGEPRTFPGALADITERKRAERELQRHKDQLKTLFDVLPVGVVVADADGRIVEANDTAADIWGGDVFDADSVADYEKYPVREASTDEVVPPEEMTLARVIDGEVVTDPDVYDIEAFDGERRTVRLEGRPIRDASGEVVRGVVTLTDITERRRYQQQLEESNERLEQFAYAASHDLQEPLRMVSSYLSLLERRYGDVLDEDGREFLEFAVDGSDRMRDMIEALLAYSRVETRGDPFEAVDLEAVLQAVIDDLSVQIEESDADIEVVDLPTVRGDRSQLRQVFQNLLSNAIEYSGDEPPRVRVEAERPAGGRHGAAGRDQPPGDGGPEAAGGSTESSRPESDVEAWVVSVADEGIGIDPENADRVFEVFQRLHSRADHEGTGIGLALCERIVERHGGDIWVESTPGEGSTFYFTLPVEEERDG